MKIELKQKLIEIAKQRISNKDPSHDFGHTMRVLDNALLIAKYEGGDLDVIIPAALFHDLVVYPKNCPRSKFEEIESAKIAKYILSEINEFPKDKIPMIINAIKEHRFSKRIKPKELESKIIQDADRLDSVGAISIMRTFCSAGQMGKVFYHENDPFCKNRVPERNKYGLDLFFYRLLKIKETMNTKIGKKIADARTNFLQRFLEQFKEEIEIVVSG